jgi:hypothetical protein
MDAFGIDFIEHAGDASGYRPFIRCDRFHTEMTDSTATVRPHDDADIAS